MPEKKPRKNKPGAGRPSRYRAEFVQIVKVLAEKGATVDEICEALGVVRQTFYNWANAHQELMDILNAGRDLRDADVEKSLYERATGYSVKEDKIFIDKGEPVIVPTIKHYPPDPTSMIFWLKNRKPAEWRDKQELEHSGGITVVLEHDPTLDGDAES